MCRRATLVACAAFVALGLMSSSAVAAATPGVSPADLVFANAVADPSTAVQTVTLTNTGDAPLKVTAKPSVDDPQFTVENSGTCAKDVALAPAATCTVDVTFDASADTPVLKTLTIPTDAGDATAALRGNAGRATADTGQRAFASVVGSASATQQVVVTNTGSGPLTVAAPFVVGTNFVVRATSCGGALAPGASCGADVSFVAPSAGSGFSATLRITTNDLAPSGQTFDVPLIGTGVSPSSPGTQPGGQQPGTTVPTPGDGDNDGVVDSLDLCPITAGDLKNGCPSELNAQIVGRWRTNRVLTQLVSLSVNTTTGARIDVRCTSDHGKCGFKTRTIAKTTKRITSLTKLFKGRRILNAGASITVRVTRPQQTGTYKRMVTRTRRRLPKVSQGCLASRTGAIIPCA